MQKVSRTLLLAGVLAFGTLTAACGDSVVTNPVVDAVQSVSVSPSNASINVGTTIQLAANVVATGTVSRTVTWTSSDATVASVDQTGKVSGLKGGTVTIIATSTADNTKATAAAIVVSPVIVIIPVPPSIGINSVTQNGLAVNLLNTNGQIDITVNTSGGGQIDVYLSTSCSTNTISASDIPVATQQATSAQAGQVVLSVNTAQLTTATPPAPRFANGNYCIKAQLTNGAVKVVATNTTPLTLNNANVFAATLSFTSQTGGTGTAVSSINGLNYREGTLNVTLNPVIFTSASPVALISGYLTRNGEQAGGASPGSAVFTNQAVTSGAASIAFTDTGSVAGVRSIFQYTSLPAGDTLYITSATDAAGNSITVPASGFAVPGVASGVRIDNDIPNNTATTYVVTAPNGYVGAAYSFASGTGGTAAADNRGGVNGVGGVTTTYYVGAAASAAFATANSCDVTGLTAATVGTDLANTTSTNADQAKVVVMDKLGNKTCRDVNSSQPSATFGVDKVLPLVAASTTALGVSANTGYKVTRNFSFAYSDSISGFDLTPLEGTLTRNFYGTSTAGSLPLAATSAADCLIGAFSATTFVCAPAAINFTAVVPGTAPSLIGSFEFTTSQAPNAASTGVNGYYTASVVATDQALNISGAPLVRTAAFDNILPTVGAISQSPATVAPLGTVTVSATAADNLNLISARGNLSYANNPAATPFGRVAGNALGTFGQFVTSATATVALPNVYRGLQSTDAAGIILANTSTPTATITVTDVGTNIGTSAAGPIATTSAATNVQANGINKFLLASSAAAGTTTASVATTTLTASVEGNSADPAFQSQPFAQIDFYKVTSGELVLVSSQTLAAVNDNPISLKRTFVFSATGVALSPGTGGGASAAAVNTFYAVGRSAAGDAVISLSVVQNNP